jgi:hypothetical protein
VLPGRIYQRLQFFNEILSALGIVPLRTPTYGYALLLASGCGKAFLGIVNSWFFGMVHSCIVKLNINIWLRLQVCAGKGSFNSLGEEGDVSKNKWFYA